MFCATGAGEVLLSRNSADVRVAKAEPYASAKRNTPARCVPDEEHGVTANPLLTDELSGVRTVKFILCCTKPTVGVALTIFRATAEDAIAIEASTGIAPPAALGDSAVGLTRVLVMRNTSEPLAPGGSTGTENATAFPLTRPRKTFLPRGRPPP